MRREVGIEPVSDDHMLRINVNTYTPRPTEIHIIGYSMHDRNFDVLRMTTIYHAVRF